MTSMLEFLASSLFYDGQLQNAKKADIKTRPKALKIQNFFMKRYKTTGSFMLMTMRDTTCKDVVHFKYNINNFKKALNIAQNMLKNKIIESKKIIILILYRAQLKLYHKALTLLGEQRSDMAKITVRTVDSMQGSQSFVVILDLVVTDKVGFLKSKHRLNVALSRPMNGLVVKEFDLEGDQEEADSGVGIPEAHLAEDNIEGSWKKETAEEITEVAWTEETPEAPWR